MAVGLVAGIRPAWAQSERAGQAVVEAAALAAQVRQQHPWLARLPQAQALAARYASAWSRCLAREEQRYRASRQQRRPQLSLHRLQ